MDSKSTPAGASLPDGVSWLADMSRADFDKRLVRKGQSKRPPTRADCSTSPRP